MDKDSGFNEQELMELAELISNLKETSDPTLWQYFKNLEKRKIVINEPITTAIIETAVLPILQWNEEDEGLPVEERKPITIYLSSNGGSVYYGLSLVDVIEQTKTPITTIGLSMQASMGGLILMAGKNNPVVKRCCYPFSMGLIHDGSDMIQGSLGQIKDYFSFQERYEKRIKDYILRNTNISEKEYDKMSRSEWYMDSDMMLEKGLVDYIIGAKAE